MGVVASLLWRRFAGLREARLLMVGLDGAGKSTILHKLKFAEVVQTVPTVGFNVETVEYGNLSMAVWDIGGQESIRKLWRHYYSGTNGVVFVVDSSDQLRLEDARLELHRLLKARELCDLPVLVYLNKQDLEGALSCSDAVKRLGLCDLPHHKWLLQPASATNGAGLYEGLDWLAPAVKQSMRDQRNSSLLTDASNDQAQRAPEVFPGKTLLRKAFNLKPSAWSSPKLCMAQLVVQPGVNETVRQRTAHKKACE
eukprot:TRINITY_DN43207_c0_g1_i1.p1 TRINITY_DN43207_c0_g1~~TRINITY_DN43207_c0_g1_i1.p1  ORF type:complete len:254 (+),score=39.73 TRINITY_DN43207_c0_g1_i1:42-803(+)